MTVEIFREDSYARRCAAVVTGVGARGIELDRTVFYPTGGGQPGDTGALRRTDGLEVRIAETVKGDAPGVIWHVPEPGAPALAPGDAVTAEIDWERRYRLARMHTCLHVLCAVVPGAVTGGAVSDGRGRLDFDLPEPILDKESVGAELNRLIAENHAVRLRWIAGAELEAHPDLVRTMSVKPPMGQGRVRLVEIEGVDLQPCGGTHIASTAEIGPVRIAKIEKKGRHNRRIVVTFDAG